MLWHGFSRMLLQDVMDILFGDTFAFGGSYVAAFIYHCHSSRLRGQDIVYDELPSPVDVPVRLGAKQAQTNRSCSAVFCFMK